MLEAARVQAERMVQRTEVVRAAEQRARQVMETAETDSRRLQHETEDFLDQRLGSFEILLDKLQKTVAAGRQRLSIGVVAHHTGAIELTTIPARASSTRTADVGRPSVASSTPPSCCASPDRTRTSRTASRRSRSDVADDPIVGPTSTSRSTSTRRSTTSSCRARSTSRGAECAGAASRRSTRCSMSTSASATPPTRRRRRCVRDRRAARSTSRRWCATRCCSRSPTSALCRDDCAGLCPACGHDLALGPCGCDAAPVDERWAALDAAAASDAAALVAVRRAAADNVQQPDFRPGRPAWPFPRRRSRSRRAGAARQQLEARGAGTQPVPALRKRQGAAHRVPDVRLVPQPRRRRRRPEPARLVLSMLPDRGRRHGRRPRTG